MTTRSYYTAAAVVEQKMSAGLTGRQAPAIGAGPLDVEPLDIRPSRLKRPEAAYKRLLISDSYCALPTMPEFLRQISPSREIR